MLDRPLSEQSFLRFMKDTVSNAAGGAFLLSVLLLVTFFLITLTSKQPEPLLPLTIALGFPVGALFCTFMSKPMNPIGFSYGYHARKLHQSPNSIRLMDYLLPRWKKYSKIYFWIFTSVHLALYIVPVILNWHPSAIWGIHGGLNIAGAILIIMFLAILGFLIEFHFCMGLFYFSVYREAKHSAI